MFHLKAVENVLLFSQARDQSVKCLIGVASMRSAMNSGASYLCSSCWVCLKAGVLLSVGVTHGFVGRSAATTGRHSWHLHCFFLHIHPERESHRSVLLAWVPFSNKNSLLKVCHPHFNFLELNKSHMFSSLSAYTSWLPWHLDTSEGIVKMENW